MGACRHSKKDMTDLFHKSVRQQMGMAPLHPYRRRGSGIGASASGSGGRINSDDNYGEWDDEASGSLEDRAHQNAFVGREQEMIDAVELLLKVPSTPTTPHRAGLCVLCAPPAHRGPHPQHLVAPRAPFGTGVAAPSTTADPSSDLQPQTRLLFPRQPQIPLCARGRQPHARRAVHRRYPAALHGHG